MQESQENSSIQPNKLAKKNGEVKFNWPVSEFERLCEMLFDDSGKVRVSVKAHFDHQQRCLLEAEICADLTLECQTSFEPINFPLAHKVTYCTVVSETQFAQVEQEFEPVMVEDGLLDIKQVIEDELILSLPIVANKPVDELQQKMSYGELDEAAIEAEKAAKNPFSVLENLKKT